MYVLLCGETSSNHSSLQGIVAIVGRQGQDRSIGPDAGCVRKCLGLFVKVRQGQRQRFKAIGFGKKLAVIPEFAAIWRAVSL